MDSMDKIKVAAFGHAVMEGLMSRPWSLGLQVRVTEAWRSRHQGLAVLEQSLQRLASERYRACDQGLLVGGQQAKQI